MASPCGLWRSIALATVVAVVAVACSSSSSSSSAKTATATKADTPPKHLKATHLVTPTLGLTWGPDAEGFGQAKPTTVFNGGDPSGLFDPITWDSWGGPQATGTGVGLWVGPDQIVADGTRESIKLVAYDLEVCNGTLAYRHLAVYFPEHGERFDPATNGEAGYDLCNGP
jgi:hypothetical protein